MKTYVRIEFVDNYFGTTKEFVSVDDINSINLYGLRNNTQVWSYLQEHELVELIKKGKFEEHDRTHYVISEDEFLLGSVN